MTAEPAKLESDIPSLTVPIVFNMVALPTLLASQAYFRHRFDALQIELPYQTEVAIGVIPPLVLVVLLLLTLAVKYSVVKRFTSVWEAVAVSACVLIVGQHIIAMCLPFLVGRVDLSLNTFSMVGPQSCGIDASRSANIGPGSWNAHEHYSEGMS